MARTSARSRYAGRLLDSTALVVSLAGLAAVSYPFLARADTNVLPQGGTVVVGAATIRSNILGSLDVTTATDRTAINWQSFSIGAGNTVTINQPNASSLTLNQVVGADPSSIFGVLKSNGQVVLANPNGIWFGPGSHVDVASIVASTATASQASLAAFARGGALMLDKAGKANASIVNDGAISIGDEGLAGLVAPGVANNGIIAARLGRVVLASGTVATLDFYGDGLISFAVGGSVTAQAKDQAGKNLAAAVVNSGTISNAGGTVLLTAAAAKTVVDNTINMSGVVIASAVSSKRGEIDLDGGSGTTNVSGELLASSKTGTGGTINVTGHSVVLAPTARLDVTGVAGGNVAVGGGMHGAGKLAHAVDVTLTKGSTIAADGTKGAGGAVAVWSDGITKAGATITATGTTVGGAVETSGHDLDIAGVSVKAGSWLLDPQDLTIDAAAAGSIDAALGANTSVTIVTSRSGPSGGFGTATGTSGSNGDIGILAPITWSTAATFSLSAYHNVNVDAPITVTGAGTLAIQTNTGSAGGTLVVDAPISFTGAGAALSIDGVGYSLISSTAGLQSFASLDGHYALAADIDASSITNFTPIGSASTPFTGQFEGLDHTVSNLSISSSDSLVGMFGEIGSGGIVQNLRLVNESLAATLPAAHVGGIAGDNLGQILNVMTSGTISGPGSGAPIGGLVGDNVGTVLGSYSTASVSSALGFLGGLVGINVGLLESSYFSGVATDGGDYVGGVVGENSVGAMVIDTYDIGTISGTPTGAGGLVGNNLSGTITNSYAAGRITATGTVGGLIGVNSGSLLNSVWDSNSSLGTGISGAVGTNSGGTTSGITAVSGYSNTGGYGLLGSIGTSLGDTWYWLSGLTRPILESEYSHDITNAHQLELIGLSLTGNYVLGNAIDASATGTSADIWNPASGFVPIGFNTSGNNAAPTSFSGSLSGNGFAITGLSITHTNDNDIGLFSDIGVGAVVSNLSLSGSVSGIGNQLRNVNGEGTGLLAGQNSGTISNVYAFVASGATDLVTGNWIVGGLVGFNGGSIIDSGAAVPVTGTAGVFMVGGFVGENAGTIERSFAQGGVIGASAPTLIAGFAGRNDAGGQIIDSYAMGSVSAPVNSAEVGGLVGQNSGLIQTSFATGAVSVGGSTIDIGGLVGSVASGGTVSNSYATGVVTATSLNGDFNFDPFIGSNSGTTIGGGAISLGTFEAGLQSLSSSIWADAGGHTTPYLISNPGPVYVAGQGSLTQFIAVTTAAQLQGISAAANYVVVNDIDLSGLGNFAPIASFSGILDGLGFTISNLSINAALSGSGAGGAGGLIAELTGGTIENLTLSNVALTATGDGSTRFGGLVGEMFSGTISGVSISGSVATNGVQFVGGLVGALDIGTIVDSASFATVSAVATTASTEVGGLVGTINGLNINGVDINGSVTQSFAQGTVSVSGGVLSFNGGLVGVITRGEITDSYAISTVEGPASGVDGGLLGETTTSGTLTDVFAIATVTGGTPGLLVGNSSSIVITDGYGFSGPGTALSALETSLTSIFQNPGLWGNAGGTTTPYLLANFGPAYIGSQTPLYQGIGTAAQLQAMGTSGDYVVETNIDASTIANFTPIGYNASGNNASPTLFTGIFDGRSFAISGLTISNASANHLGLFSEIGTGGLVENLSLTGTVTGPTGGATWAGLLVGENLGTITNVAVTGTVSGFNQVGALAGGNGGTISNSAASGTVSGLDDIGGLVGLNQGGLIDTDVATTTVAVGLAGTTNLGGLVGANTAGGSITASSASGTVGGVGASVVGGLVGDNLASTITNSSASGQVTGQRAVGGLVGVNEAGSTITASFAENTVLGVITGLNNAFGGLVGDNVGSILNSSVTSGFSVSFTGAFASATTAMGGLVGLNEATGTITTAAVEAGDLVGGTSSDGTLAAAYEIGGFVGQNVGLIVAPSGAPSWSEAAVGFAGAGQDIAGVGGFVGLNQGTIVNAYALGSVDGGSAGTARGTQFVDVGGFVGNNGAINGSTGSIDQSYAVGAVSGGIDLGGFVGYNNGGNVSNSYALGNVSGSLSFSSDAGGFIGINDGSVSDAFETGAVSTATNAGGFAGFNGAVISNGYWDSDSNSLLPGIAAATTTGAQPLSLAALEGSLPSGFDSGIWTDFTGQTTPTLLNNLGVVYSKYDGATQLSPISSLAGLQALSLAAGGGFYLAQDIDLSTAGTIAPIVLGDGFGVVDGLGHTISSLSLASSGSFYLGLFATVSGTIENLTIANATVTAGGNNQYVGVLAGFSSATISNVTISGSTINVSGATQLNGVGGLVGDNEGGVTAVTLTNDTITDSGTAGGEQYVGLLAGFDGEGSFGSITESGGLISLSGTTGGSLYVGGIVGYDSFVSAANLSASNTTIDIAGGSGSVVGGILGYLGNSDTTTLTGASATNVTISGTASYMGGIVGRNFASIVSALGTSVFVSYAGGNDGTMDIGGLVGSNESGGVITGSSLNTSFLVSFAGTAGTPANLGGLAGANAGAIDTSGVSDGTVSLADSGTGVSPATHHVGGFVGDNTGSITGTAPSPAVNGVAVTVTTTGTSLTADIGGAVGANETGGSISALATAVTVTATMTGSASSANVGGLAGVNAGVINGQSFVDGGLNVSVTSNADAGGLVGQNVSGATILQSYALGNVSASGATGSEGGLVGANNGGVVDQSFASGSATGISFAGGFVGSNYGAITNSYAVGAATASGGSAGGFVGFNWLNGNFFGSIANSYALGIAATGFAGTTSGGSITNSFWDLATSGASLDGTGSTATGVTTATLQATSLGASWSTPAGLFPYLNWQITSGTAEAVQGSVAGPSKAGLGVGLIAGGSTLRSLLAGNNGIQTFADGSYYGLFTPGTINGVTVAAYLTGAAPAAVIRFGTTGSVTLDPITYTDATHGTVTLQNDGDASLSAVLATLAGSVFPTLNLTAGSPNPAFTVANGAVTLGAGTSLLIENTQSTFSLDQAYAGTLTVSDTGGTVDIGALTLNVGDTLTVNAPTIDLTGDISGTGTVDLIGSAITFPASITATTLQIDDSDSVLSDTGSVTVGSLILNGIGISHTSTYAFTNAGNAITRVGGSGAQNITVVDARSDLAGGLTIEVLSATGAISISNTLGGIDVAGLAAGAGLELDAGTAITVGSPVTVASGGAILRADTLAGGVNSGIDMIAGGSLTATGGAVVFYYHPTAFSSPTTFSTVAAGSGFTAYMTVDSTADLGNIATSLADDYYLNTNLSLTGVFAPIGSAATPFTGVFDGGSHSISGLSIAGGLGTEIGLFGEVGTGGIVENLTIAGGNVSGLTNVGMAVGLNLGVLANVTVAGGTVTGFDNVGGVIGNNQFNGSSNVTASATIHGGIGNQATVNQIVGTGFGSGLSGAGPAVILDEALLSGSVFASLVSSSPVSGGTVALVIDGTSFGSATTDNGGNYRFLVGTGGLSGPNELVVTLTSGAGALLDDGASFAAGSVSLGGFDAGAFTVVTSAADLQTALGALTNSISSAGLSSQISTGGIVTGSGVTDVAIAPTTASFAINAAITAAGGTVLLTTTGSMTQATNAGITAGTLDLEGSTSVAAGYALTSTANAIGSLSGVTTGPVNLVDTVDLAVALSSSVPLTIVDTGDITFPSTVTLGGATSLSGTTVTFSGDVGGNAALTITGKAVFGGSVGNADVQLASLAVTGTVDLTGGNAGTIDTSGAITFGGLLSGGSNNINLNSISGTITLAGVETSGTLAFLNNTPVVLDAGSYTFSGGQFSNPVTLNGTITLGQATGFGGIVLLGSDTTLSDSAGQIRFQNSVDDTTAGAHALVVTTDVRFDVAVGSNAALASLDLQGPAALTGLSIETTGAQDYEGATTVAVSTLSLTTGSAVTFHSTLDGGTPQTALSIFGNAVFDGNVGATTSLASLLVTGTTALGANASSVTTSGDQSYAGVTLGAASTSLTGSIVSFATSLDGASAVTIAGNAAFGGAVGGTTALTSLHVTGTTQFASGAGAVTTTNGQTYDGAVTLAAATTSLTGSSVAFGSTLNGTTTSAQSLAIVGPVSFGGAVGGVIALNALILNQSGLASDTSAIAATSLSLLGTGSYTLSNAGNHIGSVTIGTLGTPNGAVSLADAVALTVNAASLTGALAITDSAPITLAGNITTGAAVSLTGAGGISLANSVAINSGNAAITLAAVSGGANTLSLTAGSGAIALSGVSAGGLVLSASPLTLNAGGYSIGGASYTFSAATVNGAITLGQTTNFGALTLAANSSLTDAAAMHFATVDGNFALSLSGNADFSGAVGGTTSLTSLTASGGTIAFHGLRVGVLSVPANETLGAGSYAIGSGSFGAVTLDGGGGVINLVNATSFGATTLASATSLTAGAGVTFSSTVNGNFALAVTSGSATYDGAVNVASLNDVGATVFSGGGVSTTGSQSYGGPVTLTTNTTNSGGSISYGSVTGGFALTNAGTSAVTFTGPVNVGALNDAGTTSFNAGSSVTTSGAQAYGGAVTLGGSSLALTGNSIAFSSTLDGAGALTLSGNTAFGGVVGGTTALTSLQVTGGTTTITAPSITTTGAQSYGGISLGAATSLVTGASGLLSLGNVAGSGHALSLTAGTGGLTLSGATVASLTESTTGALTLDGGTYSLGVTSSFGAATLNGAITLAQATIFGPVTLGSTVTLDSGGAALTLGTVSGGVNGLTLSVGSGNLTLSGMTVANLSLTSTGTTTLDAGTYTIGGTAPSFGTVSLNGQGGTIAFGQATSFGAAIVASNTSITASAGVNFLSTLDGVTSSGQTLAITGPVGFGGAIGGTHALNSLTLNQTGSVGDAFAIAATSLSLLGGGSYALTGANTVGSLSATAAALSFDNGGHNLTLTGISVTSGLSLGSVGTLVLNGNISTSSNAVDLTGAAAISLATGVAIDTTIGGGASAGAAITLGNVTGGANALSLTSGIGAITLHGIATSGNLSLSGGATTLDAGTYSIGGGTFSPGAVTLNGTIVLGQATNFGTTTLGSNVSLDASAANTPVTLGAVSGAHSLGISAGSGAVTLTGVSDAGLTVTTTGSTTLDAGTYSVGSPLSLGAVTLGGVVTLGQNTIFGAVTLGSAVTLDSSATNATITLGAVTGGANTLTLTSGTGMVTLNGITTTGNLVVGTSPITLDAGSYTFSSGAFGPNTMLNGLGQTLVFHQSTSFGVVTLASDTTLQGGFSFFSPIDGAHALTISGDAVFQAAIGATTALTSLDVAGTTSFAASGGAVTTTGAQIYGGAVTLNHDASLTGSAVSFGAAVDGGFSLTVTGDANFTGAIGGGTALTALDVAGGAVSLAGVNADSIALATDSLTLTGAVAATSLTIATLVGGGTIDLGVTNGTPTLALSAATLTALGGAGSVSIGDADAVVNLSGTLANLPNHLTILADSVTADDTVAATGAGANPVLIVSLAPGGSFTELAGASISFGGGVTIGPTQGLGGATIIIGGLLDPGNVVLDAGTGSVALASGSSVIATGSITITAASLSLGAATAGLQAANVAASSVVVTTPVVNGTASNINIGGVTSGTLLLTSQDLQTLAGFGGTNVLTIGSSGSTITVSGSVSVPSGVTLTGASIEIASTATLTLGSGVTIAAQQATIQGGATIAGNYVLGSVSVTGTIFLGGDTSIDTSAVNGNVSITDIEGTGASGGQNLTINTGGGNINIGTIGTSVAVGGVNLTTIGSGTQTIGTVVSVGGQTYAVESGALQVTSAQVSAGAGQSLIVTSDGGSVRLDTIGGSAAHFGVVSITTTGNLTLGSVTTDSAQAYSVRGGITFDSGAALSSATGAISFLTNSITGPSSVSASAVLLDTAASNGAISIGTGTNGLVVSQAVLSSLHGASLVIGDGTTAIAVDGTVAMPANLILNGASVTLGSNAVVTGAGNLTFATNALAINGQAITIQNNGTVFVHGTNGNNDIVLADGVTGTALVINSALVAKLGTGPVVIGDNQADITQAIVLPGNVSLLFSTLSSQLLQLSGTAFAGFGSSTVLAGVTIDIVFDGRDFTTTTNNLGQFFDVISGSATGHHDAVIVLTSGTTGSAFYDFTGTTLSGLNVYGATLYFQADGTGVASAVGNLATQLSALTTGAALDGVPQFSNSGITTANSNSLIIDVTGTAAPVTLPGITSTGAVTVIDSGGITLNGVTAAALALTTDTTTTLDAGTYAIGTGGFGGSPTVTLNNSVTLDRTGSFALATLSGNGPINIGTASGSGLNLSAAQLASYGANTELLLGDGSSTINAGGTIAMQGGIVFNGPTVLQGNTEIDTAATGGDLIFNGTISPVNNAVGLTLGSAGDIFFGGTVGAQTARLHQLTISTARNVTVVQAGINNGITNATLWVDNFNAVHVAGLLSVGQHSLESDGDVAIFATAVDGRIVAGNNASLNAGTISNSNVTATNIQVAAVNVSDSTFTSTRSADVNASGAITGSNITAGVANITASSISTTTVTATNITATANSYSGDSFNSPNVPVLNGGDASRGGNKFNGQPVSSAVVQLASLNVPTNARNPKTATGRSGDADQGGDADDTGTADERKKKKEAKNAKTGKTYDYANQYVEKLLSGNKSKPE